MLHAEWSWTDGRRRLWFWTATHRASVAYRSQDLRDGFYGGHALRERDRNEQEDRVYDEMKKTREAVQGIAKTLRDPAMAAYLRNMLDEAAEGTGEPSDDAGQGDA